MIFANKADWAPSFGNIFLASTDFPLTFKSIIPCGAVALYFAFYSKKPIGCVKILPNSFFLMHIRFWSPPDHECIVPLLFWSQIVALKFNIMPLHLTVTLRTWFVVFLTLPLLLWITSLPLHLALQKSASVDLDNLPPRTGSWWDVILHLC